MIVREITREGRGEHIREGYGKGEDKERWEGDDNKGRKVGEQIREGYGKGKVRREMGRGMIVREITREGRWENT